MNREGFTLIELIVILTIFTIMASVALFNFQGFKTQVAENNLAHDTALLLRQAQTFGWATLSETASEQIVVDTNPVTGLSEPRRFANGVYLKYDNNTFSNDLILYRKQTSEPESQYFNNDTELDRITMQGPYGVVAVMSANDLEALTIQNGQIPNASPITSDLSIAFSRPKPEAFIFDGGSPVFDRYVGIYIGAKGQSATAEKVIIVSRLGEILVE